MRKIQQIVNIMTLELEYRRWRELILDSIRLALLALLGLIMMLLSVRELAMAIEGGWRKELWINEWLIFEYQVTVPTAIMVSGGLCSLAFFATKCAAELIYGGQYERLKLAALSEPIEANHGETIEEVIRNIRYEPVEYLAVFDPYGKKVGEMTLLNPSEVRPGKRLWQYMCNHPGCIKVHNHPQSNIGFSANDFRSSVIAGAGKTIVIAETMVYTLELPDYLTDDDAEEIRQYHNDYWKFLNLKTLSRPTDRSSMDANAGAAIMLCRIIADMYDMTFTAEPYETSAYAKDLRKTGAEEIPACAKPDPLDK